MPKRIKLRPPKSAQAHREDAHSSSGPFGPTATARTVLGKGLNSAMSLFKNLGVSECLSTMCSFCLWPVLGTIRLDDSTEFTAN